MSKTHEGYLLIADITGYTLYLTESELEHAQETLTALLELLVENTRPPLVISRLAGDAVISYGLRDDFYQGQSFIEKIEDTYVIFRKAIERLVLNNTCQCNACANIGNLDLKFFVHYGAFGIQHISDHDELVGSDINLIHRLLKNSVTETTGIRAYALYTNAAMQQLGDDELLQTLTPHTEAYEHLGEVEVWVQDMHPVWENKRGSVEVTFPTDRLWVRFEVQINLPREQVWDYLTQSQFRNILIGADSMEIVNRSQGRVASGSVYQCYHGDKMVPHTILEWRPFERLLVREVGPYFPDNPGLSEYILEEVGEATRLTKTSARPSGPLFGRVMLRLMTPMLNRMMPGTFEMFRDEIEKDYRAKKSEPEMRAEISSRQIEAAAAAGLEKTARKKIDL
jgi:hypothetical protein